MKDVLKNLPAKLSVVGLILLIAWLFDGIAGIKVIVMIFGGIVLICLAVYVGLLGIAKTNDIWNEWLNKKGSQ